MKRRDACLTGSAETYKKYANTSVQSRWHNVTQIKHATLPLGCCNEIEATKSETRITAKMAQMGCDNARNRGCTQPQLECNCVARDTPEHQ
jgi:hypothetical protein